jgi:LacI family transcriptional regulator
MARSSRMSDVARLAGVSTMTVSRVLNASPSVSESTRQRVTAAIKRLQYQRNEVARSLRERSSRQIGILVPNLRDSFFAECSHAIGLVAKQHSYSVVISTTDDDAKTEYEEVKRMMRRNVDGLIVIPATPAKGVPGLLDPEFRRLPVVALDRPIKGGSFDSIVVQNRLGARMGTEHLIGCGHKRIACVVLNHSMYTMHMRDQGYRDAMLAAGLQPNSVVMGESRKDSLSVLRSMLDAPHSPTAIFCANNLLARHTLHSLYRLGVKVPEQVALVGFDDFETADMLTPAITVVRQPLDSLGRLAGEMLFARLTGRNNEPRGKQLVLPVELVVRGSCGAEIHERIRAASLGAPAA